MEKVYYNGKIITMTDSYPEAVLVREGKIKRVGTLDSVKQSVSGNSEWINLQGKCLIPSFIDSHSHIVMNGQAAGFANLSDCGSFTDIIYELKKYIARQRQMKKRVVVGFGYDHNGMYEWSGIKIIRN